MTKEDIHKLFAEFERKLLKKLDEKFDQLIETKMKLVEKRIEEKMDAIIESKVDELINAKLEQKLEAVNDAHAKHVRQAESNIGELQDYGRKDNLVFHNVPYQLSEDASWSDVIDGMKQEKMVKLKEYMAKVFNFILPEVSGADFGISTLHRMPTRNTKVQFAPIVVCFYNRSLKDAVYERRAKMKEFENANTKKENF